MSFVPFSPSGTKLFFISLPFHILSYFHIILSIHLCPSNPGFYPLSRDKARLATDSELDQDLSDRLGLGSSETLTNGSHRADVAAARRLAKRLFNLDGFRKSDVARHLSKK